jgi:hypothetical protein
MGLATALSLACASSPRPRPVAAPHPTTDPSAPIDESPRAEPPAADAPIPLAAPEITPPTAPLPPPFSAKERAERFPRGDLAAARAKNREGLSLRQAGDHGGALTAYEAALALSPRFVPARYNRACELALLEGDARGRALDELETLLRMDTADARLFVSRARFDPDFDAVRGDPRFAALVGRVAFDPNLGVAAQHCVDPGRLGSLIDPERGVELVVETESADDSVTPVSFEEHATGRAAFDRVMWIMGETEWMVCGADAGWEGSLVGYRLARAKEPRKCLALAGEAEWTSQFLACFARDGGEWRLASLAMWPDGPISEDVAHQWRLAALAARDRGWARFGPVSEP